MVFFKFNFATCYKDFQKHFPAETDDHSYDDVYQVVIKLLNCREVLKKNQ
jgi:hypothetical protein